MPEAPSLVVQLPGYPFTNLASAATFAALRALFSTGFTNGQDILVDAGATAGDGLGGVFSWNAASTSTDDGATIIKPTDKTGLQAGRWLLTSNAANTPFLQIGTGAVARTAPAELRDRFTLEQFGAVGDGTTDDSAAFLAAATTASGRQIEAASGKVYKMAAQLLVSGSLRLDLNGSTIKPVGNTACITSNEATATVTAAAVSSGYTLGSRTIVVASATGLAVGQVVRFNTTDATHDANTYPPSWNEITSIAGTTIELLYPFRITYLGTVTMNAFAASAFKDELRITNGKIDGSASTYSAGTGQGIRAVGFKRVHLDVVFVNFDENVANWNPLQIYRCLDVEGYLRSYGLVSGTNHFDIQECRDVITPLVKCEGSGFGINFTRTDVVQWGIISLRGQGQAEVDGDILGNSTRGVKCTGVGRFHGGQIVGEGHESLFRASSCFTGHGGDIFAVNCGRTISGIVVSVGNDTLAGTNMKGITFGKIEGVNTAGSLFAVETAPPDPQIVVDTLISKRSGKYAARSLTLVTIANAIIEDWAMGTPVSAIEAREGGIFGNMQFAHTDATKTPFDATLTATKLYSFGNVRTNTNAVFSGVAANLYGRGASTILTGTTSIVVTHLMKFAPGADKIVITPTNNPTNDPGNFYITAAGATTFTVNCRADPGASGAQFAWQAVVPDVATAP